MADSAGRGRFAWGSSPCAQPPTRLRRVGIRDALAGGDFGDRERQKERCGARSTDFALKQFRGGLGDAIAGAVGTLRFEGHKGPARQDTLTSACPTIDAAGAAWPNQIVGPGVETGAHLSQGRLFESVTMPNPPRNRATQHSFCLSRSPCLLQLKRHNSPRGAAVSGAERRGSCPKRTAPDRRSPPCDP